MLTKELVLNDLVKPSVSIVMLSGYEPVRDIVLACRFAHMHLERRCEWLWLVK